MTKLYFKSTILGVPSGYLKAVCLMLVLATSSISAQSKAKDANPATIFDLLTKNEGEEYTLITDLTLLNAHRKTDDYQVAVLVSKNGTSRKVEIKPRGKFRRKNAFLPPIKMKFSKKDLQAEGLSDMNEIKISLPFYDSEEGNDFIVKEYLAYRMYESLTAASLRARLVKLTLVDSHVESWKHVTYSMFIEDDEELCSRLKVTELETYGLDPDSLQMHQAALVSAFNYMIGNADWEIAGLRNVKLLRSVEGGKVILVPYDFDFSGLVNAPYSKPANLSGLRTTKQRFLMADGIKAEYLRRAFAGLKKEQKNLIAFTELKYLKSASQKEAEAYLESFFDTLVINDLIETAVASPMID